MNRLAVSPSDNENEDTKKGNWWGNTMKSNERENKLNIEPRFGETEMKGNGRVNAIEDE